MWRWTNSISNAKKVKKKIPNPKNQYLKKMFYRDYDKHRLHIIQIFYICELFGLTNLFVLQEAKLLSWFCYDLKTELNA